MGDRPEWLRKKNTKWAKFRVSLYCNAICAYIELEFGQEYNIIKFCEGRNIYFFKNTNTQVMKINIQG